MANWEAKNPLRHKNYLIFLHLQVAPSTITSNCLGSSLYVRQGHQGCVIMYLLLLSIFTYYILFKSKTIFKKETFTIRQHTLLRLCSTFDLSTGS